MKCKKPFGAFKRYDKRGLGEVKTSIKRTSHATLARCSLVYTWKLGGKVMSQFCYEKKKEKKITHAT